MNTNYETKHGFPIDYSNAPTNDRIDWLVENAIHVGCEKRARIISYTGLTQSRVDNSLHRLLSRQRIYRMSGKRWYTQ